MTRWGGYYLLGPALALAAVGCGSSTPAEGHTHSSTCTGAAAQVVGTSRVDDRTVDLEIESPALGATVTVRLLLPAAFASAPARKWPVLYLLHGAEVTADKAAPPVNYESWTQNTDVEQLTAGADVLVVMPEGGNTGWYSDWYNAGKGGSPAWETFHLCELPVILEQSYRASDVRAIAGLSMGGMGATAYAARHPEMFRAVASFSGEVYTEQAWNAVELSILIQGLDKLALWGSGDPSDPDNHIDDIWAKHDPYALADQLVHMPVFVSAGDGNPGPLDAPGTTHDAIEPGTLSASKAFSDKLKSLGGDVTTDFYGAGTHSWPYWERELHQAFPMLMQAIGASP